MSDSTTLEKKYISSLKKMYIRNLDDADAKEVLKRTNVLIKKGNLEEAAAQYAALATILPKDANLSLQAARLYQKAEHLDDAARCFLVTAERYANSYQVSKSVAALRLYHNIRPEDKINPKRIYEICLKNGADDNNPPSILLEDSDIAGSKLLASDIFKTFDSSNFDQLLQHLQFHTYGDGAVISKMGDEAISLFIIISGTISGYLTFEGKRTHIGDVHENNICGETAYFTGGRRTAEMVSKGVTEVFELPYSLLDKFKTEFPAFNQRIEGLYQQRMLVKQLALTILFEGVTAQCREWVATHMKPVAIKAGQVLMQQNENSLDVYLVRKGKLAVTILVGRETRLLKTIETGGIVGETSIIANRKRTATIYAYEDCILMKLDGEKYEHVFKNSKVLRSVLKKLKKRHMSEAFDIMKREQQIEGDDTCAILLKDIWNHE